MKYYVVGGQYRIYLYGYRDSLHAAKILATKNCELWDNWQGWNTPKIYEESDIEIIDDGLGYNSNIEIVPESRPYIKHNGKWKKL